MKSRGTPVLRIDLPSMERPRVLAGAIAAFDRYAEGYARTQTEKREARDALVRAKAVDQELFKAALAEDFDAEPQTTAQDAVEAEMKSIEAKLPVLADLADKSGSDLMQEVGAALDGGWRDTLVKARAEKAETLNAKIAELEAAFVEYGEAASAASWAEAFTVNDALNPDSRRHRDVRYIAAGVNVPLKQNANLMTVNGVHQVPYPTIIAAMLQVTAEPEPTKAVTEKPATIILSQLS
jgi:hypothetical protein